MGFLKFEGTPMTWTEILPHLNAVKALGIRQFLHTYKRLANRPNDDLKWGDEVYSCICLIAYIEYMIVRFNHKERKAQLSIRAEEIWKALQKIQNEMNESPEYARYCLESSPGEPFEGSLEHLAFVEKNMKQRREQIKKMLNEDEMVLSLTGFPRLGCPDCVYTHTTYNQAANPVSHSLFYPDCAISTHPRFPYLTQNIRERRSSKIEINIPIFKDINTMSPFVEIFGDPESDGASKVDHVYMDAMGFGMGTTGLQCTIQASNLDEAKHLYDQLAPICPIMLALSAASPIYKGFLTAIDTRWDVIAASVDDRTAKERFGAIESYLSPQNKQFNDIDIEIEPETKTTLLNAGVEESLANHIAHLWIRDPLTLFSKQISNMTEERMDYFENIQSTNWQSLRFKPPPPDSDIGWRIEFRPLEAQLTDFENAAYVVFVVLLSRVILANKLDFVIPMSYVIEGMHRAQRNNAVMKEKFYFRRNIKCFEEAENKNETNATNVKFNTNGYSELCPQHKNSTCQFTEMNVNTIINGTEDFPGLISIIHIYLNSVKIETKARSVINTYLNLISKRATGKLWEYLTAAEWKRQFVLHHEEYKHDSVVTDSIAYDLLMRCDQIEKRE
uniref:Glutamate--cysteine ligase n=1 Tax=Ciona savignyi TaxID=51511 RepID=H2YLE2_CIOSA